MKKIKITWPQLLKDIESLATNLNNAKKQMSITDIVGIARGGLIPAQLIAHKLDIKRVYSFGVTNYNGEVKQAKPIIYQNLPTSFEGKTVLVIDEICDTGDTFRLVDRELKNRGTLHAYYAAIYKKCVNSDHLTFYTTALNPAVWLSFPYD